MSELYIGLMSGTSIDAIDAVVVDFSNDQLAIKAHHSTPFEQSVRDRILAAANGTTDSLDEIARLDRELGLLYATAVRELLQKAQVDQTSIRAIGSHGQTVRHEPTANPPFSVQLGDPNTIAHETGIVTVADFRRRDIAAGGEGAPLVPAFHAAFFSTDEPRVIANIGGIANLTILPANASLPVMGFDTGPGNVLMDCWATEHLNTPYDEDGQWAATGQAGASLLRQFMTEPYFKKPPPKSTGRELFNLEWIKTMLGERTTDPANVQATLCALTAQAIKAGVDQYAPDTKRVLICGGGAKNTALMGQLKRAFMTLPIESTASIGIDPQWVEASAFAWLARQTVCSKPGNLPSVTGATRPVVLGGIYTA
ncbi:MAG: anhydro-N-acetylmuramic acid kinase [Gammaproteobacteria bacterium]|nr:MAG: anhydro-N-acetylmuramic acid kinase [Gammaproteobacteria bacterium]